MLDTPSLAAWRKTCKPYGSAEPAVRQLYSELAARYSGADRFYHTLTHVAAMLRTLDTLRTQMEIPNIDAVRLAVWFHDVVYDAKAGDNEERSAAFAVLRLPALGVPEAEIRSVERLILSTKTHQAPPGDPGCVALLDADLAILGASVVTYDAYVRDVRREYAWVAEGDWRVGRARVLRAFLERPRLYLTAPMFAALEDAARWNMHAELDTLA